jgi:outer membrane protein, heavy metal efflux system
LIKTKTTKAAAYASILAALWLMSGCGFQTYNAKPLDARAGAQRYLAHEPDSPEFRQFMLDSGYPEAQLPVSIWGMRELTLSALFYHPELDLARAQWRAAQSGELTAAQRPTPGINLNTEKHSDHAGGISPWTYGLSIDLPLETGGKRQARIDRAESLSTAARIDIAQTAWQVRSRVHQSWLDFRYHTQLLALLQQELKLRDETTAMLEKRLQSGMASSIEVANFRVLRQKTQQAIETQKGRLAELQALLASNSALPLSTFKQLPLQPLTFDQNTPLPPATLESLRDAAMLNRLDMRAALARYDAAEAKLRLEIARQYPDLTLTPGYSYDQGDKIWSLGISALMTMINKNRGLIAEATALRDVEGAQFQVLQAGIIAELERAEAAYTATWQELARAREFVTTAQALTRQIQRQFADGYADRLSLRTTELEALLANQHLLDVQYKLYQAVAALEQVAQRPLLDENNMPENLNPLLTQPNS